MGKTQLVAIVVADPNTTVAWAENQGKSVEQLCREGGFKQFVMSEIKTIAKEGNLQGFEIVKDIYLEPTPWEPGCDILTPTFKLQRNKAQNKYQLQIDEMYKKLESIPSKL